ncbi:hypothetical protein [Zoogloea sp.]|uniref:hypothetical protein n=1 Tax=Zoogloea sp. TaxID=49181 RepID=UPI0014163804|nr:MAG: hypothetical protein F9K15_23280 [Zoogloea sp.]
MEIKLHRRYTTTDSCSATPVARNTLPQHRDKNPYPLKTGSDKTKNKNKPLIKKQKTATSTSPNLSTLPMAQALPNHPGHKPESRTGNE